MKRSVASCSLYCSLGVFAMSDPADSITLTKMLHDFSQRADTSYVIVVGTTLEQLLELALLANMRELSNRLAERLFSGYGPLSTFSAKIDIAYAFQIIPDDMLGDFRTIKDIRNEFAHTDKLIHFNSPELEPLIKQLTGWTKDSVALTLFDARVDACRAVLDKHIETSIFIDAFRGKTAP
jgi:DNA-binding MltR family transcriptional regulator